MGKLKTLTVSNNELKDINPRIALLEDLVRLSIEGNPLKSIKPAMRSANAVQLKKYLKMRIGDEEIEQEEAKQSAARGLPNMTNQGGAYDHWDTLIREFRQGTFLDLRNKDLKDFGPKVLNLTHLQMLDLSGNP
jgi:Leucine-rich repeat (LRR) protein